MLERNGTGICIDKMPYRKKPCLCVVEGNVQTMVASFSSDKSADFFREKAMQFMDGMILTVEYENGMHALKQIGVRG